MKDNSEFRPDGFSVGKFRAEQMDLMTAPDQFLHEIDGLGGTAPRRRIKRFVSQKGEFHFIIVATSTIVAAEVTRRMAADPPPHVGGYAAAASRSGR